MTPYSDTDPTVALRAYSKWARTQVIVGIALLAVAIALLGLSRLLYDKDPYSVPFLVLLFVGMILLFAGCFTLAGSVAALFRVRRLEQTVAGYLWVRVPCRYHEVPDGIAIRGLLALEPDTSARPAVLTVRSLWRRARSGLRGATQVDYAGDPSERVIIRVPGNKTLMSANPAGRLATDPKWRKALGLASEK